MDDKNFSVPYVVYESAQARSERRDKRFIVALVIVIVLLFGSNALWLYAWMQYDYVCETTTYTQDGRGYNNINTGEGDIRLYEPETIR